MYDSWRLAAGFKVAAFKKKETAHAYAASVSVYKYKCIWLLSISF
jgi:hypothetical protein